jgi:hypothetical protein
MKFDLLLILTIASQGATVLGFAYGLFWLERYRKQKIMEHQSDNARKALDHLVAVEENIDHLFNTLPEAEQIKILHSTLPKALRELYKELLLLKQIPGVPPKIHLIERLGDVDTKAGKVKTQVAIDMLKQVFASVGGYKQQCAELKELLIRIYILRA